jgi:hypothetical protein
VNNRYCQPVYLPDLESEQALPADPHPVSRSRAATVSARTGCRQHLFAHPGILPIAELDALSAPAIPLCRKPPTKAGPTDIAYLSGQGG